MNNQSFFLEFKEPCICLSSLYQNAKTFLDHLRGNRRDQSVLVFGVYAITFCDWSYSFGTAYTSQSHFYVESTQSHTIENRSSHFTENENLLQRDTKCPLCLWKRLCRYRLNQNTSTINNCTIVTPTKAFTLHNAHTIHFEGKLGCYTKRMT